jgi:hypothetical protein
MAVSIASQTFSASSEFMPVSAIKRDMTGYGLTVFQGTKIEKFYFRVLGVLKKTNTGRDLILIRASGGPITKRGAGIIAGMSGSPCYLNGKLIGAVSYNFPYSKEPIGMVTPIADMIEAMDDKLPRAFPGTMSAPLPEPVKVDGQVYSSISIHAPGESFSDLNGSTMGIVPLMTPIMVSGMSGRGLAKLQDALKPKGILVMAGPGGAAIPKATPKLSPGAGIGMSMATGDIDMTGVGTLTYIKGNRLVAFGHPMMGIGAVDAPMTGAYVHDVIASFRGSTKIASALSTIGRFDQDRPWSIAGTIGAKANTIPVTISVDSVASGRKRTFRMQVLNHPLMTSDIMTSLVTDAIYQMQPTPGDITAQVSYDIETDQLGKISRSNSFFEEQGIDGAAASDFGNVMLLMSMNKWQPIEMKSVNVNIVLESRRGDASVDRIFVKKDEFEPGETVEIGVVLRPYKRDRITRTIQVKIPEDTPDGAATLIVRGGGVGEMTTQSSGSVSQDAMPTITGPDDLNGSDNAKQLIERYLQRERNNQIVAKLAFRTNTVSIEGKALTGLPSIITDLMMSPRTSSSRAVRGEVKSITQSNYVVNGAISLPISIRRKTSQEIKAVAAPMVAFADDSVPYGQSNDHFNYASVDLEETATKPVEEKPKEKPAATSKTPAAAKPAEQPAAKTEATPKVEAPAPEAKSVVRPLSKWQLTKQADFSKGTFDGTAVDSKDRIIMVPKLRKLSDLPEQFVWSTAAVPGGVIVGTGSSGRIYRVDDSGKVTLLYETGEVAVHSLAVDTQGNIYAGTSPSGKIIKITPNGKGSVLCILDAKHILALTLVADGTLLAGAGDSGKIYKITSDGKTSELASLSEQSIYCLTLEKDGSVLAGTGPNGVLYRVSQTGTFKAVYDSESTAVTSTAVDGAGDIYVGVAPKGDIYRVDASGRAEPVVAKASQVMSMLSDPAGKVLMTGGSGIYVAWPRDSAAVIDSGADKTQYMSISSLPTTGSLYAGTANPAMVYSGNLSSDNAIYYSPVYDTKSVSRWSSVKWTGILPVGCSIAVQTRTGGTSNPDAGWSAWSLPYTVSEGSKIESPEARYVQFKLDMVRTQISAPALSGLEISYLTANQAPDVKLVSPVFGESWSGSKTVKWTGSDPDKDSLTYELYYSADQGKNWQILLGPGKESEAANVQVVDETKITGKVKSELEKSPDVPADMKKAVLDKAVTSEAKPKEAPQSPTATSYNWDTKKLPDGEYLLKVVASDSISNALGALQDTVVSDRFELCNTPPVIQMESNTLTATVGTPVMVKGTVTSVASIISAVQYNRDGKTWMASAADDGVFDSKSEHFSITLTNMLAGTHKIEIQAIDAAGNSVKETVSVVIQ